MTGSVAAPVRIIRLRAALEVLDLLTDAEATAGGAGVGYELKFADVEDKTEALDSLSNLDHWLATIRKLGESLPATDDELVRLACECRTADGQPRVEVLAPSTWEAIDSTCALCCGRIHEIQP